MEYRHTATFNIGTPQEVSWDIYVDYESSNPQFQYIAEAHCLNLTQSCWIATGYITSALALTEMNNHVVNYIKLLPNAVFRVICYPESANQIVLNITCTAKTWNIQVISGVAEPKSGTGTNYTNTVLNVWNAIMAY